MFCAPKYLSFKYMNNPQFNLADGLPKAFMTYFHVQFFKRTEYTIVWYLEMVQVINSRFQLFDNSHGRKIIFLKTGKYLCLNYKEIHLS